MGVRNCDRTLPRRREAANQALRHSDRGRGDRDHARQAGAVRARRSSGGMCRQSGRALWPMILATVLVTLLLLVTFDLNRPTRGLITVPDTPYKALHGSMALTQPARHKWARADQPMRSPRANRPGRSRP